MNKKIMMKCEDLISKTDNNFGIKVSDNKLFSIKKRKRLIPFFKLISKTAKNNTVLDDIIFNESHIILKDISCVENIHMLCIYDSEEDYKNTVPVLLNKFGLNLQIDVFYEDLSPIDRLKYFFLCALLSDVSIIQCPKFVEKINLDELCNILMLVNDIWIEEKKNICLIYDDNIQSLNNIKQYKMLDSNSVNFQSITRSKRKENKINTIKLKILKKYSDSRYQKYFKNIMKYTVFTSLLICITSCIFFINNTTKENQKIYLNNQSHTELYVINAETKKDYYPFSYEYKEDNKPFKNNIKDYIRNIDYVKNIYPYFTGTIVGKRLGELRGPSEEKILLKYVNGKTQEIDVIADPTSFVIYPYYSEQNYEKICTPLKDDISILDNGLYINTQTLSLLGFSVNDINNLKGASLRIEIYLPVAYKIMKNEKQISEYYIPVLESVIIELPILGVIPSSYTEQYYAQNIYLPYHYLSELQATLINRHHMAEDEYAWNENSYVLFVEDEQHVFNVKDLIITQIPGISVGSVYTDLKVYYGEQNQKDIFAICICIFDVCYFLACGIHWYKKDKNDWHYFLKNSLVKDLIKIILKENLVKMCLVLFACIIWMTLLNVGSYIIFKNYLFMSLFSFEALQIILYFTTFVTFYFFIEKTIYYYNLIIDIQNK